MSMNVSVRVRSLELFADDSRWYEIKSVCFGEELKYDLYRFKKKIMLNSFELCVYYICFVGSVFNIKIFFLHPDKCIIFLSIEEDALL